jgi:hypothetical protein
MHRLHCGRARFADGTWVTLEQRGMPDFVCVHPQHSGFYMECKRPGGRLSPAQAFMHRVLAAWRLPVVVVDDVDELACWLRAHEQPTR